MQSLIWLIFDGLDLFMLGRCTDIDLIKQFILSRMHLSPHASINIWVLASQEVAPLDYFASALGELVEDGRIAVSRDGQRFLVRLTEKERRRPPVIDPVVEKMRDEMRMLFATQHNESSSKRKKGKRYKGRVLTILRPDGKKDRVINLADYCDKHRLSKSSMYKMCSSERHSVKHKGYQIVDVSYPEEAAEPPPSTR